MDEREFDHKIDGVKVPTRSASTLFSRFGSLGLLLVPQYEEMVGGRILFKRGGDCGNECLFCRVGSCYSEGINKLEQRLTKCISLKGDYVEE